ncbi:hypothetical protein I314_02855 [Cryptococcus bacillisporus CA1873]|uniref:Mediator complex subunit 16 n=1 Tax=Cryptococcus bacillisporus CA1873 TaxID=1296111 RepID=A0ABR5BCN1_CRYGA|nr:hypothetical protein I314_02855 [Cryptococcus bacillisporus CA1873]|eukprot:KIR64072.1 hypothetical protein I314_02855 [Cryptococcus gattii CA1873]
MSPLPPAADWLVLFRPDSTLAIYPRAALRPAHAPPPRAARHPRPHPPLPPTHPPHTLTRTPRRPTPPPPLRARPRPHLHRPHILQALPLPPAAAAARHLAHECHTMSPAYTMARHVRRPKSARRRQPHRQRLDGYRARRPRRMGRLATRKHHWRIARRVIQTLPMTLPVMTPPPFQGVDRRIKIHGTLQSMSFIFQPFQQAKDETIAEKVAAVLVYEDHVFTPPESIRRTRLETVAFERRPIQLAPGFSEISGGNTELSSMWEWASDSSTRTTIQTLQPLHAVPPYSFALAVISSDGRTRSRVHLDLCAKQWNPKGHYPIKGIRGDLTTLVLSQGAERGQLGLCAVVDQYRSQHVGVVNKLDEQPILGELPESASDIEKYAAWAATSIILAERQDTNWSDVIHALQAILPPSSRDELTLSIVQRIYNLAADEIDMDQLFLVSRVQIALFSVFLKDNAADARLALATDILRLNEASELVDRCATFDDDGSITFDLDSIWPLIAVFDWAISVIARAMRQAVLVGASAEWQGSNDSLVKNPHCPLLILLHPTLRSLCIRILSQLHQLSIFLSTLDRPILQPENKVLPASNTRDPMATVVAREQIRDIPLRHGVDVEQWGRALESVTMTPDQTDIDQSLIQLSITPLYPHLAALLKILHTSSTLFTVEYIQNLDLDLDLNQNLNQRVVYDAIDWSILHRAGAGGDKYGDKTKEVVVCDRCGWQTEALTKSAPAPAPAPAPVSAANTISPWAEWKSQAEENCICGGTWVRKQVEMED